MFLKKDRIRRTRLSVMAMGVYFFPREMYAEKNANDTILLIRLPIEKRYES